MHIRPGANVCRSTPLVCISLLQSLPGAGSPPAFMDELETYLEGLYEEDLARRAEAAGMLCQLFRNTANLEVGGGTVHAEQHCNNSPAAYDKATPAHHMRRACTQYG